MDLGMNEDKSFKILIDLAMADFLKGNGIEEEIIIPFPTEIMTTNCVNRRLDYCGLSKNYEIINVEFQSSVLTASDEIRIFDYASSLFVKYKLPVKTYVISTVEDKSRKIEKWHHGDVFTIYVISLKDKDGLESLNRIKSKIENNETLNGEDIVSLISIVFMKSDYTESQLLFMIAELTNKARFELDFIKDQLKAIQVILADKFIKDKEELESFKRIVNMESGYLASVLGRYGEIIREDTIEEVRDKFIKEGRLIGLDQGMELGRIKDREEILKEGNEEKAISVALWMLKKDMPVEDISEATGLSIERIEGLKKGHNKK